MSRRQIPLNCKWTLWAHDLYNTSWTIDSYDKIFEFDTLDDFWKLYNNFALLGGLNKKNYFLMRNGIHPVWEDPRNRDGGVCSLKFPSVKAEEIWTLLSMSLVGESFYDSFDDMSDINGLSICPKNVWCIIKIWNADSANDVSKKISKQFADKFSKCSIIYKKNEPED